jgi:ribosomal protein L37AE/L43A
MASRRSERAAWLVPLWILAAIVGARWLVLGEPRTLFLLGFVALAALPILWVIVSALWPARAERACPACKQDRLQRIDRGATVGVVCGACGWRDESASAWLLAEEEGPLEDVVLRQRRRARPPVDSSREPG